MKLNGCSGVSVLKIVPVPVLQVLNEEASTSSRPPLSLLAVKTPKFGDASQPCASVFIPRELSNTRALVDSAVRQDQGGDVLSVRACVRTCVCVCVLNFFFINEKTSDIYWYFFGLLNEPFAYLA